MTRAELLTMIERHAGLKGLFTLAEGVLDDDPGHNLDHALRVALWTMRIGGSAVAPSEAVAAGLLHDLVNLPKDSPDRHLASERSAEAATPHLRDAGFDEAAQARIQSAIRDHSFSRGAVPTEALGCALQDADRLEALGAIGAFRNISTGTLMGSQYFHAADPWARERDLDDKAYSLDHFFVKLLRLPATMRTEAGRVEATRRARVLIALIDALSEELGVPLGPHPLVDELR
jgi:uncharacterized protein